MGKYKTRAQQKNICENASEIRILKDKLTANIISMDNEISELNATNLMLSNKIKLHEKTCGITKLIEKDKHIHELKESIKNDFINFGENMMPKNYVRISQKFPHLTLPEIIEFEKKVRMNGGNISVHSGKFRLGKRLIMNHYGSDERWSKYIAWDCCHAVGRIYGKQCRVYPDPDFNLHKSKLNLPLRQCTNHESRNYLPINEDAHFCVECGAIDLVNPSPDGSCDFPEIFYLNEEDYNMKDIRNVTVRDVSLSISHNIDVLEKSIEEHTNKIIKLKSLRKNIDLLLIDKI